MSGNKVELIKQLAASYGLQTNLDPKKIHYDAATGTLYCEGNTIPKHTLDKAFDYFENQKNNTKSLAERNPDLRDIYLFNVIACNAIKLLHESAMNMK